MAWRVDRLRNLGEEEERRIVMEALDKMGGNQTRVAKMLGISGRALVNRLQQWKPQE